MSMNTFGKILQSAVAVSVNGQPTWKRSKRTPG
jgi:hypothetical protein